MKSNFAATIGNFDGVHLGHQELIKKIKQSASKNNLKTKVITCLLYTSPSPRDLSTSRMPSSA